MLPRSVTTRTAKHLAIALVTALVGGAAVTCQPPAPTDDAGEAAVEAQDGTGEPEPPTTRPDTSSRFDVPLSQTAWACLAMQLAVLQHLGNQPAGTRTQQLARPPGAPDSEPCARLDPASETGLAAQQAASALLAVLRGGGSAGADAPETLTGLPLLARSGPVGQRLAAFWSSAIAFSSVDALAALDVGTDAFETQLSTLAALLLGDADGDAAPAWDGSLYLPRDLAVSWAQRLPEGAILALTDLTGHYEVGTFDLLLTDVVAAQRLALPGCLGEGFAGLAELLPTFGAILGEAPYAGAVAEQPPDFFASHCAGGYPRRELRPDEVLHLAALYPDPVDPSNLSVPRVGRDADLPGLYRAAPTIEMGDAFIALNGSRLVTLDRGGLPASALSPGGSGRPVVAAVRDAVGALWDDAATRPPDPGEDRPELAGQGPPEREVYVRADADVRGATLAPVLDALADAGVQRALLVAMAPDGRGVTFDLLLPTPVEAAGVDTEGRTGVPQPDGTGLAPASAADGSGQPGDTGDVDDAASDNQADGSGEAGDDDQLGAFESVTLRVKATGVSAADIEALLGPVDFIAPIDLFGRPELEIESEATYGQLVRALELLLPACEERDLYCEEVDWRR